MKKGIDISKHQGVIDWKKVKTDGVEFAMIRTGYWTNYVDEMWEKNYSGAKSAGIKVGAYHYSYSLSTADAVKEAQFMISLLKGKSFDYPIAFDIEDTKQTGLGKKVITDIIVAFTDTIKSAGYRPMIYINTNWRNNLVDMTRLNELPLWQAHYPPDPNLRPAAVDNRASMWQYTEKGKVNGITTTVDMNWDYDDLSKVNPVLVPSPVPPPVAVNALGYATSLISTNNMRVTSGYRTSARPNHNGIDFTDAQRLELKQDVGILAFDDGTVTDTTVGSLIGYSVSILHANNLLTRYFHMKAGSVRVKVGDKVKKGQQIGIMGATGDSTGIHLHFETKERSTGGISGTWVNPENYLLKPVVAPSAPPQTAAPSGTLKPKDKVKVIQGAKTYTGGSLASFVYARVHEVYQISGDRVVIAFNGEVTAAVNMRDLIKV